MMKSTLALIGAAMLMIGCWGGGTCDGCGCEAGCCDSGTCDDDNCTCVCTK